MYGRAFDYFASAGLLSFMIPLYAGHQSCPPGHAWGGLRDHYLLHLVRSGRGSITYGSTSIELTRGYVFLMQPNQYMSYQADQLDPWQYVWVGFRSWTQGSSDRSFGDGASCPATRLRDPDKLADYLWHIVEALKAKGRGYLQNAAGWLQLAVAELSAQWWQLSDERPRHAVTGPELVHEARAFVDHNYHREITVRDVVRHIGLDQSYLNRLFRRAYGVTLGGYLTRVRMARARELVVETSMPIRYVASSVGYHSYEVFERCFRSTFDLSPSAMRGHSGRG